jgi:uncharacterized protein (TIGR02271 family)
MTTTRRSTTVVGVFHNTDDARDAIDALKKADFPADSIGLLAHDRERSRELAEETGTRSHAGEGAATGLVAGGILGGLGGWLVGIGALAIPGVGPFIAAGALGAALTGAAIGAGVGAVAGALIGLGIPKEEAEYYEGEVRGGRTLVTVQSDGRYDEARSIMRDHGAYDFEDRGTDRAMTRPAAIAGGTVGARSDMSSTGADMAGQQRMQLREEELRAEKRQVETGQVVLGKDVVEQRRSMDVPVTREEVTIERQPVERRPSDRPIDETSRTIEVPVRGEHVEVEKQPVVYEEVGVGKRAVTETESVSETVRREEARVSREGDVNVHGWNEAMPTYRQRWQQRYGSTGGRWEDYEPNYRYGYEMRSRPEYRGRSFSEVEPSMRSDWERRYPNSPWDRARENVRETWDEATS